MNVQNRTLLLKISEPDGTVWSFRKLCEMEPFKTKQECKTNIIKMFDFVALILGNTLSVCKKYYVADSLIRAYENETAFPFFKKALRKSSKSYRNS